VNFVTLEDIYIKLAGRGKLTGGNEFINRINKVSETGKPPPRAYAKVVYALFVAGNKCCLAKENECMGKGTLVGIFRKGISSKGNNCTQGDKDVFFKFGCYLILLHSTYER
jgi:hypothetical protein